MNILMIMFLCFQGGDAQPEADTAELMKQASYVFGNQFGKNVSQDGIEIDVDQFLNGLTEGLEGKSKYDEQTTQEVMRKFQAEIRRVRTEKAKVAQVENLKAAEGFLAENKDKEGIITTESGLQYKVLTAGEGEKPKLDDKVTVHYKGTLLDGKEFDSSYKRNKPATFPVKGVIPGWIEVLQLMPVGAKYQVYIPPKLGYGPNGAGANIPGNSLLIFDIELVSIDEAPAAGEGTHTHEDGSTHDGHKH